jgi:4-carboxymuconolactone decarboxylase
MSPAESGGRPRLRVPRPQELDGEQRVVYDDIAGGRRAAGTAAVALTDPEGRLVGPFGPMLLSPPVGGALQALGAAVRYSSVLTDRVRELAVLAVAHHWDSAFERYAHEALGRQAGLTEGELNALRHARDPDLEDEAESVALLTVRALLERGDLDDDEHARACDLLGERALFELLTLVGYYGTLALQLRVYRIGAPTP